MVQLLRVHHRSAVAIFACCVILSLSFQSKKKPNIKGLSEVQRFLIDGRVPHAKERRRGMAWTLLVPV